MWGVPVLRSPALGQTSFRGHSPGFPAFGIVGMFGSFGSLQTQESQMLGRLFTVRSCTVTALRSQRGLFTGASSGSPRLFIACSHSRPALWKDASPRQHRPPRSSPAAPTLL